MGPSGVGEVIAGSLGSLGLEWEGVLSPHRVWEDKVKTRFDSRCLPPPALCLPVIGFGNWEQMEMRQRVQELVMAPLEALTGAMKNVVAPAPQSPLPKAAAGTAVVSGTGTESEIGNGIETENGNGTEIETENGIEIETGTGTEIETGTGTGIETERALSAVSELGWWGK